MKVLAINGSPRAGGNTFHALQTVCAALHEAEIETEILHIGHSVIRGCAACYACAGGQGCAFADGNFLAWAEKLYAADGVIVGSPVYYSAMAGTLKAFMDRAFFSSRGKLRHKIAAGVAVARRSGGMPTFQQLNNYFLISEMIIAPSHYWNVAHGMNEGEVMQDAEGLSVLRTLGTNMAWLLRMREATRDSLPPPAIGERARTNFIR
jgi:multimeric flavodoxin WrbA